MVRVTWKFLIKTKNASLILISKNWNAIFQNKVRLTYNLFF